MARVIVGAVQIACSDDEADNLARLEAEIRSAARRGAKLIVTQELFEGLYFPQDADLADRARAGRRLGILSSGGFRNWRASSMSSCPAHSTRRCRSRVIAASTHWR